jgi:hypothetical protein
MRDHSFAVFRQLFVTALCGVFFIANCALAHSVETSFWTARKMASQRIRGTQESANNNGNILLAQLPKAGPVDLGRSSPSHLPATAIKEEPFSIGPKTGDWLGKLVSPYGSVREVFISPDSKAPLIVHIQDAHGIEEAQRNIASMMGVLAQEPGIHTVGLEAAWGPFSLAPYRDFPDPNITKEIADLFLKKGFIAGPEYAGLTLPKSPIFFGAENKELYDANLAALKTAYKGKQAALKKWETLYSAAAKLKEVYFSENLKTFDRHFEAYHAEKEKLSVYVRYLVTTNHSLPHRKSVPNLKLLVNALDEEDDLDFKLVEIQRKELVGKLVEKLTPGEMTKIVEKSVDYRAGRVGYGDYHSYLKTICETHGINLARWPQLKQYISYVILADKIDKGALLEEMDALDRAIPENLARSAEEKNLVSIAYDLSLMAKLLRHEMSMADWVAYQKRAEVVHLAARLAQLDSAIRIEGLSAEELKPFEDFCFYAVQRNTSLVDNLLREIGDNTGTSAVLVAGGFHTEGLSALMRQRKVSYVVVTPKITEIPKDNNYMDLLANDPIPLEKQLAGDRIYLARAVAMADPLSLASLRGMATQSLLQRGMEIVPITDKTALTTNPKYNGSVIYSIGKTTIYQISHKSRNRTIVDWLSSKILFLTVTVKMMIVPENWKDRILNLVQKSPTYFEDFIIAAGAFGYGIGFPIAIMFSSALILAIHIPNITRILKSQKVTAIEKSTHIVIIICGLAALQLLWLSPTNILAVNGPNGSFLLHFFSIVFFHQFYSHELAPRFGLPKLTSDLLGMVNQQDLRTTVVGEGSFSIVYDIGNGLIEKEIKQTIGHNEQYLLSNDDREVAAQLMVEFSESIRDAVKNKFNGRDIIPPLSVKGRVIQSTYVAGKSFSQLVQDRDAIATPDWVENARGLCDAAINAANRELLLERDGRGVLPNGWQIQVDTVLDNFLFDSKGNLLAWIDPIALVPPQENKVITQLPEKHWTPLTIDEKTKRASYAVGSLLHEGFTFNPIIYEIFTSNTAGDLPDKIFRDEDELKKFIRNTSLFASNVRSDAILGTTISVPEFIYPDGKIRGRESGEVINVSALSGMGIDPAFVLMFRRAQPSTSNDQLDLYWTSDLSEARTGLTKEISGEKRRSSVVLVADLSTILEMGHGAIRDMNDDQGLSIRMIRPNPFNHERILGTMKNSYPVRGAVGSVWVAPLNWALKNFPGLKQYTDWMFAFAGVLESFAIAGIYTAIPGTEAVVVAFLTWAGIWGFTQFAHRKVLLFNEATGNFESAPATRAVSRTATTIAFSSLFPTIIFNTLLSMETTVTLTILNLFTGAVVHGGLNLKGLSVAQSNPIDVMMGSVKKSINKLTKTFEGKIIFFGAIMPIIETGLLILLRNHLLTMGFDPSGGFIIFFSGLMFATVHTMARMLMHNKNDPKSRVSPVEFLSWVIGGGLFMDLLGVQDGWAASFGVHAVLNVARSVFTTQAIREKFPMISQIAENIPYFSILGNNEGFKERINTILKEKLDGLEKTGKPIRVMFIAANPQMAQNAQKLALENVKSNADLPLIMRISYSSGNTITNIIDRDSISSAAGSKSTSYILPFSFSFAKTPISMGSGPTVSRDFLLHPEISPDLIFYLTDKSNESDIRAALSVAGIITGIKTTSPNNPITFIPLPAVEDPVQFVNIFSRLRGGDYYEETKTEVDDNQSPTPLTEGNGEWISIESCNFQKLPLGSEVKFKNGSVGKVTTLNGNLFFKVIDNKGNQIKTPEDNETPVTHVRFPSGLLIFHESIDPREEGLNVIMAERPIASKFEDYVRLAKFYFDLPQADRIAGHAGISILMNEAISSAGGNTTKLNTLFNSLASNNIYNIRSALLNSVGTESGLGTLKEGIVDKYFPNSNPNNFFYEFLSIFLSKESSKKWGMKLLPIEIFGIIVAAWTAPNWGVTLGQGFLSFDAAGLGAVGLLMGLALFKFVHYLLIFFQFLNGKREKPNLNTNSFAKEFVYFLPFVALPLLTNNEVFFAIGAIVSGHFYYSFDSKVINASNEQVPSTTAAGTLERVTMMDPQQVTREALLSLLGPILKFPDNLGAPRSLNGYGADLFSTLTDEDIASAIESVNSPNTQVAENIGRIIAKGNGGKSRITVNLTGFPEWDLKVKATAQEVLSGLLNARQPVLIVSELDSVDEIFTAFSIQIGQKNLVKAHTNAEETVTMATVEEQYDDITTPLSSMAITRKGTEQAFFIGAKRDYTCLLFETLSETITKEIRALLAALRAA